MSDIGHYESNFEHTLHSPWEKSLIERTVEYLKDRTEAFDDYYHHGIQMAKSIHLYAR
jgi:putative transposase